MNNKFSTISFGRKDPIIRVIKALDSAGVRSKVMPAGIALIVGDKNKLLGIATDGDIRRGLGRGVDLSAPIESVMNRNPVVVKGPISRNAVMPSVREIMRGRVGKGYVEKILVLNDEKQVIDIISSFNILQISDARFRKIGIVGLGYVGLTLAVTLSELGFKVTGIDSNKRVVRELKKGRTHVVERGLSKMLEEQIGANFNVEHDFKPDSRCDVYILAVGTPVKKDEPDMSQLKSAAQRVGSVLKVGDLVVLRSTAPIGTTRGLVIPLLEKESGLKAGDDFLVSFAPERTIEGQALEELKNLPQVIGGLNHASTELASGIFGFLTKSIVSVESLEEAEMVKLVNNTYRDVTFSFANELSLIARAWRIDTRRVIEAANYGYERSRVPYPSPGVGGYCLTKDPLIFINSSKKKGHDPRLFRTARTVSGLVLESICADVFDFLEKRKIAIPKARIFIMGFAFKGAPATADVRGSTTNDLIRFLKNGGIKNLEGYDTNVSEADIAGMGAKPSKDVSRSVKSADVVIVMTNNRDFESVDIAGLMSKRKKPVLFFDAWDLYSRDAIARLPHIVRKYL